MAEENAVKEVDGEKNDNKNTNNKTKKSLFSRVWNGLFRLHGDDFEKRLQYISKEEATLLARMQRRSSSWRATARNLIIFSVFLEVVAVAYAILTTRSVGLDWKMRATRVLPIFLWPALSTALYSGLFSFTRMRDHRDQKTLEALRAERQAKIDELKERTNYYTTQQLIQRYDPDPAAKAAAASVLASKLGADSGLKVFLGDESQYYPEDTGRSNDVEPVKSNGLRKRNPSDAISKGSNVVQHSDKEILQHAGNEVSEVSPRNQLVVEHHNPASFGAQDGSWIARVAALLVGEDPSQSYALICGNCHMHNGLARKEDFPVITYYCPRCRALNKPRSSGESSPKTSTHDMRSSTMEGAGVNLIKQSSGTMIEKTSATSSPVADSVHVSEKASATSSPVGELEVSEKIVAEDPASQ